MSKLYITEYAHSESQYATGAQVPREPHVAKQVVDFSGGANVSAALNAATELVRLHADAACSFVFGTNPAATVGDARISGGATEFRGVEPGSNLKIGVIANS